MYAWAAHGRLLRMTAGRLPDTNKCNSCNSRAGVAGGSASRRGRAGRTMKMKGSVMRDSTLMPCAARARASGRSMAFARMFCPPYQSATKMLSTRRPSMIHSRQRMYLRRGRRHECCRGLGLLGAC